MKHSERFERAIQALVTAFFDGTLAKGKCSACAVGNIVAAGYGLKVDNEFECPKDNSGWARFFMTSGMGLQLIDEMGTNVDFSDKETGKKNIEVTGYSLYELARVEYTFEVNTSIHAICYKLHTESEIMEDQYNGLMAVVEVLCDIEGIDKVESIKEKFAYTN